MDHLRQRLADKKRAGLYRVLNVAENLTGVKRIINGRAVLSFCSNDYLGLASDKRVIKAFQDSAERYGVGSGAAALINGRTVAHDTLEKHIAEFTHRDRALLFSTGYMANLGVTSVLANRNTYVFEDRLNHASLIDGARLAQAKLQRYPHLDIDALREQLTQTPAALVMTDAVFSMDGDCAKLPELADLCRQCQATLVVDDAHGFGVLGTTGGGSLEQYGLDQNAVPVLIGTFGKACGTFGAFVAGSEILIETLIQEARTYIYTTALPSAIAEATLTSLGIIARESWRRKALQENIALFKQLMSAAGLPQTESQTAIQPLIVGSAEAAQTFSETLFDHGIHVSAIRPPTVPAGKSRLRITLSAEHKPENIKQLVNLLTTHYPAC